MGNLPENEQPLTPNEIAQYCSVSRRTIFHWINDGKIKAYKTPGNHSRVKILDFIQFLEDFNIPVPEKFKRYITPKKQSILIVDDDRLFAQSIRRYLNMDDLYEINLAYDGFDAGVKFKECNPGLVILDIRMPGLDGYTVCKNIKSVKANEKIKIIAISGYFDKKSQEKILGLGANAYLAKPFSFDDLQLKINELLDNSNGTKSSVK